LAAWHRYLDIEGDIRKEDEKSMNKQVEEKWSVFLEAASVDLYRKNAFRVLCLPIDVLAQQVSRRAQEITMREKLGYSDQKKFDEILPLIPPPKGDGVKAAAQRLLDPALHIIDEFFWFWPLHLDKSGIDDEALFAMERGDYQAAVEIWKKHENGRNSSIPSTHNLAVLYHLFALDMEYIGLTEDLTENQCKQKNSYWKDAYLRWKNCVESEKLWDYLKRLIVKIDDPRLTMDIADRIRASLPLFLLSINASIAMQAAEVGKKKIVEEQLLVMIQSGFETTFIEEVFHLVTDPLRKKIKLFCASAEKEIDKTPEQANKAMQKLIKQTKQPLELIDLFLPENDSIRVITHDELALLILQGQINFANKMGNWSASLKLLGSTFKLMESAFHIAASEATRQRIKENIDIVKSNLEALTCWFCQKSPAEDGAEAEVKMYGNVTRFLNSTQWQKITIKVPRCQKCKSAHTLIKKKSSVAGITIGALISLTASIFLWKDLNVLCIFLAIFIIPIVVSVCRKIGEGHSPKGTSPQSKKYKFPAVKEMEDKGWKIGEKP
jgi:hypothetical protein